MSAYSQNFGLVDFSKEIPAPPRLRPGPAARSDLPAPQVLSDYLDGPVQCQATGKWHDSKSALRRGYKAAGVIEKGNDKRPPFKMPRTSRAEVRATVQKARARVDRGERNIHKGK